MLSHPERMFGCCGGRDVDELEVRVEVLERELGRLVEILAVMGGLLAARPSVHRPVPSEDVSVED